MSICSGCGGVVGRDCYNPQECLQISQQMQSQQIWQPSGIPELDVLVLMFANGEIDLDSFAARVWNTAYNEGFKFSESNAIHEIKKYQ